MEKKKFKKIYVEILNSCNLKCSFCLESKRDFKVMNVEEFEEVISKIYPYTNLIALHVKGEPLMHPNLKEILDVCERYGIHVNITTNGTLLYKNSELFEKSSSVRQINLSLHSINKNENTSEYNTKTYMEQIFKGVNIIKKDSEKYISYRLWNLEEIEKNSENKEIIEMLEKEYCIENLQKKARKNQFIKLDNNIFLNQDIEFTWPSMKLDVVSTEGKCWGLRNQIAILSNGDVVPCCLDQDANIKLGNIFEGSLEEIINSPKAVEIIKGFENNQLINSLCQRCGFIKKFNK